MSIPLAPRGTLSFTIGMSAAQGITSACRRKHRACNRCLSMHRDGHEGKDHPPPIRFRNLLILTLCLPGIQSGRLSAGSDP